MGRRPFRTVFLALSAAAGFVLVTAQSAETAAPVTATVPDVVRRPDFDGAAVYPSDIVIGSIGAGDASSSAYLFARRVLGDVRQSLVRSALLAPVPEKARLEAMEKIASSSPKKYRLGGGQLGVDGSTSFLFRFIGLEKECVGSIYIREDENGSWSVEDIMVEDPRQINDAKAERGIWMPYDRFF